FESGTQNLSGIAGLLAAVEFLQEQGITTLRKQVEVHLQRIIDGLQRLDGVRLFVSDALTPQGDAIAFNIEDNDPAEVGFRLDHEFGICVRVGLHCAPEAHHTLGTFPQGTVRVSPGVFTRADEIETFLDAVGKISQESTST
ncbi:MAG: aminotransferase class V-fold PLP-dependent enzyme, partial [Geopsychrobacter sp.]|nr:aminotransferase class V-fold PLP-dependent enzyme [Geopsychrobacter sp.]